MKYLALILLLAACEPEPVDFNMAMDMRDVPHVGGADAIPSTIR